MSGTFQLVVASLALAVVLCVTLAGRRTRRADWRIGDLGATRRRRRARRCVLLAGGPAEVAVGDAIHVVRDGGALHLQAGDRAHVLRTAGPPAVWLVMDPGAPGAAAPGSGAPAHGLLMRIRRRPSGHLF